MYVVIFQEHVEEVQVAGSTGADHLLTRILIVRVVEGSVDVRAGIVMADLCADIDGCGVGLFLVYKVGFILPESNGEEHLKEKNSLNVNTIYRISYDLAIFTFLYIADDIMYNHVQGKLPVRLSNKLIYKQ